MESHHLPDTLDRAPDGNFRSDRKIYRVFCPGGATESRSVTGKIRILGRCEKRIRGETPGRGARLKENGTAGGEQAFPCGGNQRVRETM